MITEENVSDDDFADYRGGFRNFVTSKMENSLTVLKVWKPLTIVLKSYILDYGKVIDIGSAPKLCNYAINQIGFYVKKYFISLVHYS